MMVALSGNSAIAAAQAASPQPAQAAPASSPVASRATAQDTVSISAQGQQMAAQSADHDGDGS
jgi:hypothetical protein